MKHLEAFTLGKKFGHPEMNEDSLVIMPDLGYAVIDGVTDRNGTTYDGMLSGRFASRTVRRAVETFLLAQGRADAEHLHYRGPAELIAYLATPRSGFCTGSDFAIDGGLRAQLGVQ